MAHTKTAILQLFEIPLYQTNSIIFKNFSFLYLHFNLLATLCIGSPGSSYGKESVHNVGDPGLTPRLGGFPGEGTGYPLKYSCLENSTDRGP